MRRQSQLYCQMDVSALASVILASLFLLIGLLPGSDSDFAQTVELPKSEHSDALPGALSADSLLVGVSASGDVYFGNVGLSGDALPGRIRSGVAAGAERRVYLIIDARTHYQDVKTALHEISLSGIQEISFITR